MRRGCQVVSVRGETGPAQPVETLDTQSRNGAGVIDATKMMVFKETGAGDHMVVEEELLIVWYYCIILPCSEYTNQQSAAPPR